MNDLFLRACRGEAVERTPIWVMRQAGRYLPEYREVRSQVDFLTLCRTPELAAKVTLQPIDRFGFDASILFSDILIPAEAMGIDFRFEPGPVLDSPVRTMADIERLRETDPEESVPFVFETVRILRRELDGRAPLIGFAASPFTLAAYLIEGRGTKGFDRTRRMLIAEPAAAHALLERVTRTTVRYLRGQVAAGAQALQLFDSWAGLLGTDEYREFGVRYARQVLDELADLEVPRIYFALNSSHLTDQVANCGADVIGVDWRQPLDRVSAALGGRFPLQGNLDPCALFAPPAVIEERVRRVLALARDLPGHIFNLGHGILPETPIEGVETLVRAVRESRHPGGREV